MKVLVIIVSYNFDRWMAPCLMSLRQTEQPVDILVVDNASQDCTVERLRREFPEVRVICNAENLGFGQANNVGMQIAMDEGYEAVFLLNQDAWVDAACIATLCRLSRSHPECGILSPTHLTGNGQRLDPGFATYCGLQELPSRQRELVEVPFVNAAFWFIPIAVIRRVGMFSTLFYHYGEDKDFVNRLTYHHLHVAYSPQVFGWHDREFRQVTDEAFLRAERVYHLSEYANINHSFGKAFAYSVLACLKKAVLALTHGKARLFLPYIRMALYLSGKTGRVLNHRKTCVS